VISKNGLKFTTVGETYQPNRIALGDWDAGFSSKEAALDFERYLKTASGKAFARKRLIPSPQANMG
jgi:hypothetical protein